MNKVFCSTGALLGWPNNRDYNLLKQCKSKIDCDGYEFMMYDNWRSEMDRLKSVVTGIGLSYPIFHIEKDIGNLISRNDSGDVEKAFELFDINCELASEIGSNRLVLHLWGGIDSDKDIANNIKCYNELRRIADSYKLVLTIENVVCNVSDPMSHLRELSEKYSNINFTFDTKMSEFHNQTSDIYLDENRSIFDRIAHFHINDYNGGYMDWSNLKTLHIGDGKVDFEKLFGYLKANCYNGDFTIEATSFDKNGVIDFERLNKSIDKAKALIL